jgi:DNA invertase Pin-like site-specific DNA recombinase
VRVVAYVRVSTNRQAEDGQGLPVQEKAIRAWCRTHGHRLVAIYRDDAFCGRM